MGATHGRVYRLLYFVKSRNGTINISRCIVFLRQYIRSLYFLGWRGKDYSPPSHPPKSATACTVFFLLSDSSGLLFLGEDLTSRKL